MTAQPLSWHIECHHSMVGTLFHAEKRAAAAQDAVDGLRSRLAFYDKQIEEAQRRGMTAFDADRLLVSRKVGR